MLGPNHQAHQLATRTYDERLQHAARIRSVQNDRRDSWKPFDRDGARQITAARLAASLGAVVLAAALFAGATAAGSTVAGGGALTLIR